MPKMSGGEAAVQALLAQAVDTLFVLPGVQNDELFSALYDDAEQLRVIVTRHEQAAGYMAYGYAAATGRPGAYCVVPGLCDQDAAGIGAPEEPIGAQMAIEPVRAEKLTDQMRPVSRCRCMSRRARPG